MGDVIHLTIAKDKDYLTELHDGILSAIMNIQEPMIIAEVIGVLETVKYEILKLGEQDFEDF